MAEVLCWEKGDGEGRAGFSVGDDQTVKYTQLRCRSQNGTRAINEAGRRRKRWFKSAGGLTVPEGIFLAAIEKKLDKHPGLDVEPQRINPR
jgi:hypothetical protein